MYKNKPNLHNLFKKIKKHKKIKINKSQNKN